MSLRSGLRAAVVRAACAGVLPGILALGACFAYRTPRGPAPDVGTHVTIRLAKYAADSLAMQLGPGVTYVEGIVVGNDSAGLQLAISHVEGLGVWGHIWNGERFTFPHDAYYGVEERHLNVGGTVLLGGLAVGAVVAMYGAFGNPVSPGNQGGGIVGPAQ